MLKMLSEAARKSAISAPTTDSGRIASTVRGCKNELNWDARIK